MKKLFLVTTIFVMYFGIVLLPTVTFAAETSLIEQQTQAFVGSKGAGFGEPKDPREVAATIIQSLLGLLGILMIAYFVYGGYLIMTSAGQEDRISKGKSVLRNAVIGLAIILSAYGLAKLVTRVAYGNQLPQGFDACIDRPAGVVQDPFGGQVTKSQLPYCDEI